jgi:hypothetical protein
MSSSPGPIGCRTILTQGTLSSSRRKREHRQRKGLNPTKKGHTECCPQPVELGSHFKGSGIRLILQEFSNLGSRRRMCDG